MTRRIHGSGGKTKPLVAGVVCALCLLLLIPILSFVGGQTQRFPESPSLPPPGPPVGFGPRLRLSEVPGVLQIMRGPYGSGTLDAYVGAAGGRRALVATARRIRNHLNHVTAPSSPIFNIRVHPADAASGADAFPEPGGEVDVRRREVGPNRTVWRLVERGRTFD